jgi:hypothetical protein
MEGGVISGNSITSSRATNTRATATYSLGGFGGGVAMYEFGGSSTSTMTKTGGIIYGDDNTGNDADGYPLKNTAQIDGSNVGGGHAVCFDIDGVSTHYQRNSTAYEDNNIDTSQSGSAGGWD